MSQGRYLYAVTRGLSPAAITGETAIGGAPLDVVEHRGLSVLVSTVDLDEFGEEALRRNLEDIGWLEKVARAHDDVVRLAAAHGTTAPLRLVTICIGDDGVRARLDESYDRIEEALRRVDGRVEWSVKAFAHEPAPQARASAPSAGGAAYLRARKAALEGRREQDEAAAETAERLHAVLTRSAVASRRLPPQDPRLSGHEGRMTLNAAYLVEEAESATFAREVERLAAEHPDSRLTAGGPWPPYSFATLEET